MKILKTLLLTTTLIFLFTGCTPLDEPIDDDQTGNTPNSGGSTTPVISPDVIDISGDIDTDQTWITGETYYISGNTQVNAVITIEPGCLIKFSKYATFKLGKFSDPGKIIANGTEANPIYFTSYRSPRGENTKTDTYEPERRNWQGLDFYASGSVFNYCYFEYAIKAIEQLPTEEREITITNCTFTDNFYGIYLNKIPSDSTTIANNRMYNNYIPLAIYPSYNIGTTNTFTDETGTLINDQQCIQLSANAMNSTDGRAITLTKQTGVDYYAMYLISFVSLTLEDGVILKMDGLSTTYVDLGRANKITLGTGCYITSEYDDSVGINLDGKDNAYELVNYPWDGVFHTDTNGYNEYNESDNYRYSINSSN